MAARAIWAGTLKIGSSSLPVKLYSAVQDKSVHFHILDAKNKDESALTRRAMEQIRTARDAVWNSKRLPAA